MPLVCVRSYLKSLLKYKFLIFDTYHPDTIYLREQGCGNPWLFFEDKRGPGKNIFWKHRLNILQTGVQVYFIFNLQINKNEVT